IYSSTLVEHVCPLKAKKDLSDEEENDMLDYLNTSQYQMAGIIAISLSRISNEYTENYTHAVKEDLVKFYGNSFYLKVVKEHVTLYCHGMINVDFESEVEDDILPVFVKERVQRWCRVCASNQQQLLRVHLVDLQKRHWHHLKNRLLICHL
ncbi:uncharacterized protein LOC123196577, partial [Mangifera indica]|uniref:uncharacterized protein LOC123196577 n=1 Tax=Mangifera indica TaxID=29780 RepID=UPI001CFBE6E5